MILAVLEPQGVILAAAFVLLAVFVAALERETRR